jgi:predicted RNA binding protein YcfA (HicA-like mRNA interferase family)
VSKAVKRFEAAKNNPAGVTYAELVSIVESAGFKLARKEGSHRVFTRSDVAEIINLQAKGRRAKPYQVKQVIEIIERYGIVIGG